MSERLSIEPGPQLLQEAIDLITSEFNRPTELSIDYAKGDASKATTFTVETSEERVQYVLSFDGGGEEDAEPTLERQ